MRSLAGTPSAIVTSQASSRATGRGAPRRTSTSRRPMRTISPGQSASSLPLKRTSASPG
jgi:hypothetical protein